MNTKVGQFPTEVPIDWFDAEFFNKLPRRIRAKYINNGFAFPPRTSIHNPSIPNLYLRTDLWQDLPDDKFMALYAQENKAIYMLPTAEEMEEMGGLLPPSSGGRPRGSSGSGSGNGEASGSGMVVDSIA